MINPQDVKWVEQPVIKLHDNPPSESQWEFKMWMPDWLAEWDVFANWEVERFHHMRDNLTFDDVLFEVGAELGWMSVIYANFVSPQNMVLIEPSSELWPNIKYTWQRNYPDDPPQACYFGLFSDKTTSNFVLANHLFPAEAEAGLMKRVSYRNIKEHGWRMPQMALDDYVHISGIVPTALTIDTEGSELRIPKGALYTLTDHNLKVWVSVHPELSIKDYGTTDKDLFDFMDSLGYQGTFLATDHEDHWYFEK